MQDDRQKLQDERFMSIAVRMAQRGLGTTAPNPAVGAILVACDGQRIISRGWTCPGGRPHAEPVVLDGAGGEAKGATLYVTLEPCSHHGRSPPCADAIIAAGVARVVVGIEDPDPRVAGRGLERLRNAGISVERGVLRDVCHRVTLGHILRVTERRPFVQLKMALAADASVPRGGKGAPTWVTGADARAHGHLLRATCDAILVGQGTLVDDNPSLTCRLPGLRDQSPVRVILAGRGQLPQKFDIFDHPRDPVLWITGRDVPCPEQVRSGNAEIIRVTHVEGRPWLPAVMEALVERGITRLLVEGGPTMWRAFDRAGQVDEAVMFRAREQNNDLAPHTQLSAYVNRTPMELVKQTALANDDMIIFRRRTRK